MCINTALSIIALGVSVIAMWHMRYPLCLACLIFLIAASPSVHAAESSCSQLENLSLPTQDMPTEEEIKTFHDCPSQNFYYGIGSLVDYVKARKCAYYERSHADDAPVIGGASVLMMLYANGEGVQKNIDIAMKFACEVEGAPAEISGRMDHLHELKTLAPTAILKICREEKGFSSAFCHGHVDICDDITSGYMEGFCAQLASNISEAKRAIKVTTLTASWTTEQKRAFELLEKAANAYFGAHGSNEMDQSGSGHAAFDLDEEEKMKETFQKSVDLYEKGHFPVFSSADFIQADKALNTAYAEVMKSSLDDFIGVTHEGIKATEKTWLAYRNAWVAFANQRYPSFSAEALKASLTTERTEELKAIRDIASISIPKSPNAH